MRADRLIAAVLLLQARGRITAADLADELEISVSTARRDLEALSAAGVPVYPQPGRGGGWQLLGGSRTDLTGLTAPEVEALFLLLGNAAPPSGAAGSGLTTALRKLIRALPATFRADAEAAAAAVHVDPSRWGAEPPSTQSLLSDLQAAVVHRQAIEIAYTNRAGAGSRRVVEPLALVDKDHTWYLIAQTPGGQRTFRVDRIGVSEPTGATFERPAGIDPAELWARTVYEVERHRSAVAATVRVPDHLLPVLRDQFGRHLEVLQISETPDPAGASQVGDSQVASVGPTVVRLRAHLLVGLAEQLAGWGDRIEVVEPLDLRHELARIGASLSALYGPAVPPRGRTSGITVMR